MTAEDILKSGSDAALAKAILDAFKDVEQQFFLENWKYSQLDAGHFVEAARRFIELKLFGAYTPLSQKLPNFTDQVLTAYEKASGDEAYKIIIPRVLYAAYCIRNKRGVGHLGQAPANAIDASLVVQAVRWALAELIRLNSTLTINDTAQMIETIVERRLPVLWKSQNVTLVLNPKIPASDQVLILLLDSSPQTVTKLQSSVGYANTTNFNKIIKRLQDARLVHRDANNCEILPPGKLKAQAIVQAQAPWLQGLPGSTKTKKKKKKK